MGLPVLHPDRWGSVLDMGQLNCGLHTWQEMHTV
jgi:hypothetical protein